MIKHPCYLKGIVRNQGKGRAGLGVELFRLDAATEEEVDLTEEESEAIGDDNEQSSIAVMRVYENIGEDFWTGGGITAQGFAEQLDGLGDIKKLNLHINCLGGDTHTAQAIYNILADHHSRKTTYIDGIAASAATVVACGANEVVARRNSNYMIHNPWTIAIGNADDMRSAAEVLDKITDPIVGVYRQQVRGKIDDNKIRSLMDAETWMTAEEALEYGFVDRISGKVKAAASSKAGMIVSNGRVFSLGKYQYKNTPKFPKAKDTPTPKPELRKIDKPMTTDELRVQHPEIYNSIQQEARVAERARLSALDAMKSVGNAELDALVERTKADGKQPSDIAMDAFNLVNKKLGEQTQLNALKKDAAGASGVLAGDAPNKKSAGAESKVQKGMRLMNAAFANSAERRGLVASRNGSRN